MEEDINNTIISFYKDAKTRLINNTFKNLLKAGFDVTLIDVKNAIKDLDVIS